MLEDGFPIDTQTANSAEQWLSLKRWLREKRKTMTDKFLTDFSAGWRSDESQDDLEKAETYTSPVDASSYKRYMRKASILSVAGCSLAMDENGCLTIQQDRNHIWMNAQQTAEFIAALNSLSPAADRPVIDINTQSVVPGSGQMSQNDKVLLYQKAIRAKRGW